MYIRNRKENERSKNMSIWKCSARLPQNAVEVYREEFEEETFPYEMIASQFAAIRDSVPFDEVDLCVETVIEDVTLVLSLRKEIIVGEPNFFFRRRAKRILEPGEKAWLCPVMSAVGYRCPLIEGSITEDGQQFLPDNGIEEYDLCFGGVGGDRIRGPFVIDSPYGAVENICFQSVSDITKILRIFRLSEYFSASLYASRTKEIRPAMQSKTPWGYNCLIADEDKEDFLRDWKALREWCREHETK